MGGQKAMVFDIKRGVSKDGPGLRTSVFLKGCPLACLWCHNPESQSPAAEFDCAGTLCGREMTVEEVITDVRRDAVFYAASGGGLTITGGEPMMQADFTRALAEAAKADGIHVAVDTCGFAPWTDFERLLPSVDLFLYDLKCLDGARHVALTGVENQIILENLRRLDAAGKPFHVRCPLVPGLNDRASDLAALRAVLDRLTHCQKVELCPYHSLGAEKYERFHKTDPLKNQREPTRQEIRQWEEVLIK